MKLVVANPDEGKTYQLELDEAKSKVLLGKRVKEVVSGDSLGLSGYELEITGGSDKDGFPMRVDLHGTVRKKILMAGGAGFHAHKAGERMRKTVRGNTIADDIAQVNAKVVKKGKEELAKLAPKKEGEKKEEKKPEKK
jgi:small subunit ribosomal protein S6e